MEQGRMSTPAAASIVRGKGNTPRSEGAVPGGGRYIDRWSRNGEPILGRAFRGTIVPSSQGTSEAGFRRDRTLSRRTSDERGGLSPRSYPVKSRSCARGGLLPESRGGLAGGGRLGVAVVDQSCSDRGTRRRRAG